MFQMQKGAISVARRPAKINLSGAKDALQELSSTKRANVWKLWDSLAFGTIISLEETRRQTLRHIGFWWNERIDVVITGDSYRGSFVNEKGQPDRYGESCTFSKDVEVVNSITVY